MILLLTTTKDLSHFKDILFFVSCYKSPTHYFPSLQPFSFCSSKTRLVITSKLNLNSFSSFAECNSFACTCHAPHLWNSLPTIDLTLSTHSIKALLKKHLWNHFINHFNPLELCTFYLLMLIARTVLTCLKATFSPYS